MSNRNSPAYPTPLELRHQALGLTKRELASIQLKVPNSGDEQLDALIRAAKRDEFAAMLYQGMNSTPDTPECRVASASIAVKCADALLKALEVQGE